MERIQRALEISRLQRPAQAAVAMAAAPAARSARVEPQAPPTELACYTINPGELRKRRVLLPQESGVAARAYRMLRAQLLQRARGGGLRVFGIVSAVSGEGKTLTAVNLALSLSAEPNQRVALVDFDLRHPSVAQTLGIAPSSGLETWLTSDRPVESVLCEIEGIERLCIAPTLAPLDASSETLATGRAGALLEEFKAADPESLVLIDLPPVLLGDDALTVAPLIDGFILVVTESKTRREDVERVLELLGRDRVIGTILNNSTESEQRAY